MRNTIVLLACLLLFVTPALLYAQDEPEGPEFARNKAWLSVNIHPRGGASVTLVVPVEVHDREQLKRALAESFSFPLQFRDFTRDSEDETIEENLSEQPWTILSARSQKAFSGGMKSTCEIAVQPLVSQLRQHPLEGLKIAVFFHNETDTEFKIKGAQQLSIGNIKVNHYAADVDLHDVNFPVLHFSMGYSAGDIFKTSFLLIIFVLLPALWTNLSARRSSISPEELWGRHILFLTRLLNIVWIAWLPIYFLSGIGKFIFFAFGSDRSGVGQIVDVAFCFIPPVVAMVLCHLASRRVYKQLTAVDWSPRQVVRHAVIANTLSLIPMFLVIMGMNTFSRSPRQAALYAIIGYIGFILLSQNMARLLGSRLHALSSGELRDRIFDLAHRAGVKLQQVYVLPETNAQLSNAFARSDNSVMITDSLLKNLSRREVDGIMAHEIGHLQAKHPQRFTVIMVATIVAANFVGLMITKIFNLESAIPLVFGAAVGVAYLVVFFRSRHNERQADAIGISLTGDPEAFISGLAKLSRLNLMLLHSGRWGKSLDTHPAAMSRFQEIAAVHGITESRLQELVTDAEPPQDRYPALDDEVEATVFSSEFKNKYRLRVAVCFILVLILAPVPFAVLLSRDEVSFISLLGNSIAGIVWTFAVAQVVRNHISFWGYRSLGQRLKMKLEKRGMGDAARYGTLVGLAPAAESRKYEGYPFWDIGVLWLTKEKLYYIGEQCQFALERGQVSEVYSCDTNREWFSERSLFIRWKDYPAGATNTVHFVATGEASVSRSRRAIESLQQRLQAWMYQSVSFLPAPPALKWIGTPAFPEITSSLASMTFQPGAVFKAATQLALYAIVIGFAIRLSYTSILYMAIVAFLATAVDEFPKAFEDKQRVTQVIPPAPSFESGNYQAGSWKNA